MLQISIKKRRRQRVWKYNMYILVVRYQHWIHKIRITFTLKIKKTRLWIFWNRNAEVTKMAKFGFSRSFYCVKIDLNFLKMIFFWEYWIRRNFNCWYFLITLIFDPLNSVEIGPIFVSSAKSLHASISKNIKISCKPGHF